VKDVVFVKLGVLQQLTKMAPDVNGAELQQWFQQQMRLMGLDPNAIYQELEMSSRFVDTHSDTSFSNTTVQLHSHDFYEILCCTNNCGAEYLVGSRRYRIQKGDIIFVSPGVSHRPILSNLTAEGYKRDVLWLSTEFVRGIVDAFPEWSNAEKRSTDLLRTAGTRWEFLAELIHRGVAEGEKAQAGWETAVVGNAMVIVANLYRAFHDKNTKPLKAEKPELLDRVMAYIDEFYMKSVTIGDIAQRFYVSQSTISHLFKEKLGVSFYHCVTQRRLIAAKELIARGEFLETVGEQVGFSDYSSFYRAFKREYGISPRQYRKLQSGSH